MSPPEFKDLACTFTCPGTVLNSPAPVLVLLQTSSGKISSSMYADWLSPDLLPCPHLITTHEADP